jgi:hypothetical protein
MRALTLSLLLPLGAAAEELVLTDEVGKLRVELVSMPKSANRFWAKWQNMPGVADGSAMLEREEGASSVRFQAPGGAAGFAIEGAGQKALVKGSTVPAYRLLAGGRREPVTLVASSDAASTDLERRYRQEHGLPLGALPKVKLDAVLSEATQKTNDACGSKLRLNVDARSFAETNQQSLPVVGQIFLQALGSLCSDADYRGAVQKLTTLEVSAARANEDLVLRLEGGVLKIAVRDDVANPRARVSVWLTENL